MKYETRANVPLTSITRAFRHAENVANGAVVPSIDNEIFRPLSREDVSGAETTHLRFTERCDVEPELQRLVTLEPHLRRIAANIGNFDKGARVGSADLWA